MFLKVTLNAMLGSFTSSQLKDATNPFVFTIELTPMTTASNVAYRHISKQYCIRANSQENAEMLQNTQE